MADNNNEETSKEPFVSQADRPEVRLRSDTAVSELTVRDLATLLGQLGPSRKDFWDGKDWAKDDFDGPGIKWKPEKLEKIEKPEKFEKAEKFEKNEKLEKREIKELKLEKIEADGLYEPNFPPGPDPRLDRLIQALSGLTTRVADLADQVEELKRAREG